MTAVLAILAASLAWFFVAAALFFNPLVDPLYAAEEGAPAVRALPKGPATIGRILLAVVVQCTLWYGVYVLIRPALPAEPLLAGLVFGAIVGVMKMVPRDIDRWLLTTYPKRRMAIEFVIGLVCGPVVGLCYAFVAG